MAILNFEQLERPLPPTIVRVPRLSHPENSLLPDQRMVPEEVPVAFVYDGTTVAVVMASPADIVDLAIGFSLTEGIVESRYEISDMTIISGDNGIEIRMWLAADRARCFHDRQRQLVGPTGCGLCGVESLAAAIKPNRMVVGTTRLFANDIETALQALARLQDINHATRATHAAGFYVAHSGLVSAREDVGRHNALDKLAGALAWGEMRADIGAVVLTSRVSVEMVQKTAAIGAPVLIAMSAPTALAVRTANACGMTLVAIARGSSFEIFTHADRVTSAVKA